MATNARFNEDTSNFTEEQLLAYVEGLIVSKPPPQKVKTRLGAASSTVSGFLHQA